MLRRVLLLAGGGLAAALAVIAVLRSGGLTVVPVDAVGVTILVGAGGAAVLVGVLLPASGDAGRVGSLLAASGMFWFLGVCATPGAPNSFVFTIGLVAASGSAVVIAHLAFVAPAGGARIGLLARATVVAGYLAVFALAGVAPVLFADPRLHGCAECPSNPLLVRDDPSLAGVLATVGAWVAVGWSVLASAVVISRIVGAIRRGGRVSALVSAFALVFLLAAARPFLTDVGLGAALAGGAGRTTFWALSGGALAAMALTLALARMTARRRVRALARLLLGPGPVEPPGMTASLRTALGDPTLRISYPTSDGGYVTDEGESVDAALGEPLSSTPLRFGSVESALILHRPALFDLPGLREDVGSTARLGLAHERLLAIRRAQLRALEASRDRLEDAADAERRRLARDLHDGAQQQLVGLALLLRFARSRVDELGASEASAEHVTLAQNGVDAAIETLRSLTRGLHTDEASQTKIQS
ncbi:histidine kinase [Microbacterium sp. B2969]|uniref:Histidine kinase n=1 Tax=Microbacterium alkaliflavum TaxID=3248839 RepID=A0ABW7QDH5_9MICO